MEHVFKAIADPSRRLLLERLLVADGQTLMRLCRGHAMTRQAVTKHLLVLERAGVISSSWQGREKRHWLKPETLQHVRQWILQFENRGAVSPNGGHAVVPARPAPRLNHKRQDSLPRSDEPESRSFSICGVD